MKLIKCTRLLLLIFFPAYLFAQDSTNFPFQNPKLPLEQRVDDLVSRMTLEEKVGQMQNQAPAISRLGIPAYDWWNECLHGVGRNGIATVFPQAIGMAATWDPDLIQSEADVISTEARAKHNYAMKKNKSDIYEGLTFWSPNINIFRDPRWGRGQETYGEDPFLTSRIGVAFVKGLQGNDPNYLKVVSTPKHYAVHSGPEYTRHTFDARISLTDLYETYLPAFEACVIEGKAWSVMGAYNRLFGEACCASHLLLQDILRDKWGFQGYVVTDCGAIWDMFMTHKMYPNSVIASAKSLKAGTDITCGNEYQSLLDAVKDSLVTEQDIDRSMRRLMTARFALGMFDQPEKVAYAQIPYYENDTEAHSKLARKVAQESIILLKNENKTLPLDKKLKTITVIGPYADNVEVLLGNYNGTPSHPVTILQGIRNAAGDRADVKYCMGVEPLERSSMMEYVDAVCLKPPGGVKGKGLLAEYFDNLNLEGEPVFSLLDSTTKHEWGADSPGKGIPTDSFSVRWTGKLVSPKSGLYKIGISTDDKGRLYFDGKLVIDNWQPFEVNKMKTFQTQLEKGNEYDIKIEYAEDVGEASFGFKWVRINSDADVASDIHEAVQLSKVSDVAVVVTGISSQLEGEEMPVELEGFKGGDRTTLELPANQQKLLKALSKTGTPTVLVLTNGSALAINWEKEHIPAIIDAWYPGQQGGNAVADVLFGKYNPAGRLPVTFYKSVNDLPPYEDYNMEGRTYRYFKGEPLYPFGHGLSYTKFDYKNVEIDKPRCTSNDTIHIDVTVTNSGEYDGDEVVQLYARSIVTTIQQPIKSLKGFKRVYIKRGETKVVQIPLAVQSLRHFDETKNDYVVEPGTYDIEICASSSDIRLKTNISVVD